jgi:hypothetical protein
MNKLTDEAFLEWAKESRWLMISEAGNPKGRQATYMTPAGELVIIQYNLQGELEQFIKPVPMAMPMPRMGMGPPGLDLRGGQRQ